MNLRTTTTRLNEERRMPMHEKGRIESYRARVLRHLGSDHGPDLTADQRSQMADRYAAFMASKNASRPTVFRNSLLARIGRWWKNDHEMRQNILVGGMILLICLLLWKC